MSGALAKLIADALPSLRWNIESTGDLPCTSADIAAIGDRVAQALRQHGVLPDEPVVVRIGNRPSDFGALLGVWQAGAVAVPLHVNAAADTAAALQQATGARLFIDIDRLEVIATSLPPERPLLRDAALVIFTSGSTGQPKGVVIGHRRFAAKLDTLDRLLAFQSDDVVLVPLQLTFIFGLWVSLLALKSRARLILVPRFSAEAIGNGLRSGATVLAGVPSMFRSLAANPAYAAPALRLVLTGGEVLPKPLAVAMQKASPRAGIFDLYGLTETGSCDFVLKPGDQPDGLGTIGVPTEGVAFRIGRGDGSEAPPGEAGELRIGTPFGLLGYLDNPQLTADSFDGAFFKTGDLARLRADGRVEPVGRSKDIVSRGGNKIAPLEIDNLLCEHPAVAAALCAGIPDERLGEVIHAAIVLRPGTAASADELRTWMQTRTERYKIPDAFHFCEALPAGPTGKADRRAVAQFAKGSS